MERVSKKRKVSPPPLFIIDSPLFSLIPHEICEQILCIPDDLLFIVHVIPLVCRGFRVSVNRLLCSGHEKLIKYVNPSTTTSNYFVAKFLFAKFVLLRNHSPLTDSHFNELFYSETEHKQRESEIVAFKTIVWAFSDRNSNDIGGLVSRLIATRLRPLFIPPPDHPESSYRELRWMVETYRHWIDKYNQSNDVILRSFPIPSPLSTLYNHYKVILKLLKEGYEKPGYWPK